MYQANTWLNHRVTGYSKQNLRDRGQRVMLDRNLAEMYNVETRVLNQAVKRNMERFPEDFMFQLTDEEFQNWKSQIVITNSIAELAMKQKLAAKHRNPIGFIKPKE